MKWLRILGASYGAPDRKDLIKLYREEDRLMSHVNDLITAAIFDASDGYALFGDDMQRWTWDVPRDGAFHVDPKWPTMELQIGIEDPDRGVRSCYIRPIPSESCEWSNHFHPDACETIHVLRGRSRMNVDHKTINLKPGSVARIAAGVPHSGVLSADGLMILSYQQYGQCDVCLHMRGQESEVFPACGFTLETNAPTSLEP